MQIFYISAQKKCFIRDGTGIRNYNYTTELLFLQRKDSEFLGVV